MSLNWDKINEARQGYIDKHNKENEKTALEKGLTEEQISAIEDICRLRHDIHTTSWEDMYNSESQNNCDIENAVIEIHKLISDNNLPPVDIDVDIYAQSTLTDIDWYDNWDISYGGHHDEYHKKAQKEIDNGFVLGQNDGLFPINDVDDLANHLWLEHVREVNTYIKEEINSKIEHWLRTIDEQYGTHYAPTGGQRLY